jgi:hypothetical protein
MPWKSARDASGNPRTGTLRDVDVAPLAADRFRDVLAAEPHARFEVTITRGP